MTRRFVCALVCFIVVGSACGEGARTTTQQVISGLSRTRGVPRIFRYTDEPLRGGKPIVVEGKIEDDLRYSGTVTLGGKPLYQEIVSDDSVAVRLLDIAAAKTVIDAAKRTDAITGEALAAGKWVIDHTVAPPLLAASASSGDEEERTADKPAAGRRRVRLVGDDPFTDAAQAVNYIDRAVRAAYRTELFNPEDIDYNSLDDPWSGDADVDLEAQGLRRYDVVLPPLPPPAARGQRQSLPAIEHFRKMAIYLKGERMTRAREQISVTDRREFRRAEQGRGANFALELRDAALGGAISDELRERRMDYEITRVGDVTVRIPPSAVEGLLGQVLPGLKDLFEFEFIGGDNAPVAIPGAGSPAASP